MSNINIRRVVENMRPTTTAYTPIVEMITNSIQAIDEAGIIDGRIHVRAVRLSQESFDGTLPDVIGFEIEDNGIGFTDAHCESFDTLYSDFKIKEGGKGFGRFTALRYFEKVEYESTFESDGQFMSRAFTMGWGTDIIVDERTDASLSNKTGTVVSLSVPSKRTSYDKKISTIASHIVEKLLPYFIAEDYSCPEIIISDLDGSESIRLNDFVSNELSSRIREIKVDVGSYNLPTTDDEEEFSARVFKVFSPGNQRSRISLVAHRREVMESPIHRYVPEFEDEFFEGDGKPDGSIVRNYIVKVYVFGDYLDENVSLERTGFEFGTEPSLLHHIGRAQIESKASAIAKDAMGADIRSRQEKKVEIVQSFVDEQAPWHKSILSETDLGELPLRPSEDDIDSFLHRKKYQRDVTIRRDVKRIVGEADWQDQEDFVAKVVERASDSSKDELVHYVAFRRMILDLFNRSLQIDEEGTYSSEGRVHDIIFPRRGDSDSTPLDRHNLWIIDERLNFTNWVSSDIPLDGGNTQRPDLLVYDKRVLFRGENVASNPVTIFEFKKPQRDDFTNRSSPEDPVQQIVRYVNDIRDGRFKTREGRNMLVTENTPFYGYVVCDLTKKVETWLEREKDFTPMPDRRGWFNWMGNNNLYVEVLGWDKVLDDATKRNEIFFKTLGI